MPFQTLDLSGVSKPTSSFLPLGSNPAPTTPDLIGQGVSAVKSYADSSAATVPSFGQNLINAVAHPLQSAQKFASFVAQPFFQNTQNAGEAAYNLATDKGIANKVADTAHLISGVAGAAFSPITSTFNVAETIPGAKQVADVLSIPFEVLGNTASWSTGKIVDYLPIPQESKDIIKQPLQDLGSLVAQVVFGGKVMDRITALSEKGTEITPDVAKKIVDEVKQEVPAATDPGFQPLKTPAELHTEYARSQGYEPYTPADQLPTIEAGATPKESLPTIQTEAPKSTKMGDLTVEPIKNTPTAPTKEAVPSPYQEATLPTVEAKPSEVSPIKVSTAASRSEASIKPIETGGELTHSKSVTIDSMQEHLTPDEFQAFKDSTSHEKANRVEQAQKTANFVNDYPDKADSIAFRGENPPEGIRHQDVLTELKRKAEVDYRAGKIPLDQYQKYNRAYQQYGSRTASELGARAGAFDKNDPAAWLAKATEALQKSDVKYAREGEAKPGKLETARKVETKRAIDQVTKEAKASINYESIINDLIC